MFKAKFDTLNELLFGFTKANRENANNVILTSLIDQSLDVYCKLTRLANLNYSYNRDIVQNLIGILETHHLPSSFMLHKRVKDRLLTILTRLVKIDDGSLPDYTAIDMVKYIGIADNLIKFLPEKLDIASAPVECVGRLSDTEVIEMLAFVNGWISVNALNLTWNKSTIYLASGFIYIARACALKIDKWMWYYQFKMMIGDRISTSDEYQAARDWAEGAIMISFKDEYKHYGYLTAMRIYSSQHNSIAGLLYLDLLLDILEKGEAKFPEQTIFEIYWTVVKVLREVNIYDKKLIDELCKQFDLYKFWDYNKDCFYHSLFAFKLLQRTENLPNELADYLNEGRERILKQGEHGAIPWYFTLIQVQEIYSGRDVSCLDPYIQIFDTVLVDKSKIQHPLNLIRRQNLANELKREFSKLQSTRSTSDFANDATYATIMAKRLIDDAYREKKYSDFWLAMAFRSDFGFIFPEKMCPGLKASMELSDYTEADINVIYDDLEKLRSVMLVEPTDEVGWIGKSDKSTLKLSLYKDTLDFSVINWNWEHINKLKSSGAFLLKFDSTTKDKSGVYQKTPEEFVAEYTAVREMVKDVKLDSLDEAERLLLVKDMDVSFYPHHLFLDSKGEKFIGETKPTANIISTEVLTQTNFDELLEENYSCSFWCPVDCEQGHKDLALLQLFSNIKSYMINKGFSIHISLYPKSPLSSEINIVCAHGAKDIQEEQCFYVNGTPIRELNNVLGNGKLLILFTCYSGSMQTALYQSSVHSLIKRYIRKGYTSIIAPMWGLPIDILSIWMPKFFEIIDNGGFAIDALYKANMEVKQQYADPAAWACLHFFGNPYMKIWRKESKDEE